MYSMYSVVSFPLAIHVVLYKLGIIPRYKGMSQTNDEISKDSEQNNGLQRQVFMGHVIPTWHTLDHVHWYTTYSFILSTLYSFLRTCYKKCQ